MESKNLFIGIFIVGVLISFFMGSRVGINSGYEEGRGEITNIEQELSDAYQTGRASVECPSLTDRLNMIENWDITTDPMCDGDAYTMCFCMKNPDICIPILNEVFNNNNNNGNNNQDTTQIEDEAIDVEVDVDVNQVDNVDVNISETCPYDCPEHRVCKPIYKNGKISKWGCVSSPGGY